MPAQTDPTESAPRNDPRTFCRGTGFIFQVVGLLFFLGGCCIGSLSGLIQTPVDIVPAGVSEWLTQSPPGQVIAATNIIVTGLGGLALMVFGIGLQHERLGSTRGAIVVSGVLSVSWCSMTGAAILTAPGCVRIPVHLLFSGVSIWLLVMALAARRELRLNPPPPDEPVTPEFLEEFSARRKLERELRALKPPGAPKRRE